MGEEEEAQRAHVQEATVSVAEEVSKSSGVETSVLLNGRQTTDQELGPCPALKPGEAELESKEEESNGDSKRAPDQKIATTLSPPDSGDQGRVAEGYGSKPRDSQEDVADKPAEREVVAKKRLVIPSIPETSIQLQADWKMLKRNEAALSQYFKVAVYLIGRSLRPETATYSAYICRSYMCGPWTKSRKGSPSMQAFNAMHYACEHQSG